MNKALIGMDKSGSFRVSLGITTTMVEEARRVHNTSPVATAALGRVLTGAGLMALSLKEDTSKLTVQFKGDGPAGEILVTGSGAGTVKGYISNPDIDLPLKVSGKLDVGGAVGKGTMTVIKDVGMREPYVGKIDIVSGEIAEDFTSYFALSEQQPSSVALGVLVNRDYSTLAAGGLIIQMMPDARDEAVVELEKRIADMPPISDLVLRATEAVGDSNPTATLDFLFEEIFKNMSDEFSVEVLEYRDMDWECDCSEERLEQVVISIGEKDLKDIIEEDGEAELVCQFCRTRYYFDKEHLERLLSEASKNTAH